MGNINLKLGIMVFSFLLFVVLVAWLPQEKETSKDDFPVLKGPYLGQKPPQLKPEVFAPGIVSTPDGHEFSCTFSADGKEFYFNRSMTIMVCQEKENIWTAPEPVKFTGGYRSHEPHITADNRRLFYGSMRPRPGYPDEKNPYGIWMTERTDEGWSEPVYVSYGINPMYVTASQNGNIYLTNMADGSLVRTKLENGKFAKFENLNGGVNSPFNDWHPCIAPDESYILFDSNRPGSHQGAGTFDLYVCFRMKDGSWSEAINIGEKLNINSGNIAAYISPDGKYLFYNSRNAGKGDIYWVDAKVIENLKPKALK